MVTALITCKQKKYLIQLKQFMTAHFGEYDARWSVVDGRSIKVKTGFHPYLQYDLIQFQRVKMWTEKAKLLEALDYVKSIKYLGINHPLNKWQNR
jgi:hypothetical protein